MEKNRSAVMCMFSKQNLKVGFNQADKQISQVEEVSRNLSSIKKNAKWFLPLLMLDTIKDEQELSERVDSEQTALLRALQIILDLN